MISVSGQRQEDNLGLNLQFNLQIKRLILIYQECFVLFQNHTS